MRTGRPPSRRRRVRREAAARRGSESPRAPAVTRNITIEPHRCSWIVRQVPATALGAARSLVRSISFTCKPHKQHNCDGRMEAHSLWL